MIAEQDLQAAVAEGIIDQAQAVFDALARHSIDMNAAGEKLQADGLRQFEDAFAKLLELTGD